MNRNSKRRRSSDKYEASDESQYQQEEKKTKYDEPCSSEIDHTYSVKNESSSHLGHSDLPDEYNVSSECECDNCKATEQVGEHSRHDEDVDICHEAELELRTSEFDDELKDYDNLVLSPCSNTGYSSCDERIPESDLISSPVAESIGPSDDEDDAPLDTKPAPSRRTGDAVSFMGQFTPASSVTKSRSRTPDCQTWTSFRKMTGSDVIYFQEAACPVPQLSWANREKFWEVMCRKDELSLRSRNAELFENQMYLRPRMRVILLDWISEVAEVFKLHRETYYLTVDYIDRYLTTVPDIPKQQLQLIGITCLVLASKMEEIYPPKIDQFANVTDGACTEEEIFSMEVTILGHLGWLLSPITINNWLEMMLQFIYQKLGKRNQNILLPHFSSTLFKRLCQLLDLVTLDITSLRFSYGVLAASAIYILVDPNLAISSSGLKKEVLEPCVQWMTVYWDVLREHYPADAIDVSDLLNDRSEMYFSEQHPELQTHDITMQLYDLAQTQFDILAQKESIRSDNTTALLTPPPSSSKSMGMNMSNEASTS